MTGTIVHLGATERVILMQPAADAVAAEVERLGASKVFLLASGHLQRETEEIRRMEAALGVRHAVTHVGIRPHVPLGDVIEAANAAREAGVDLIVAVGGGSVIDASKLIVVALKHDLRRPNAFAAFQTQLAANGEVVTPAFESPDIGIVCVPTTLSGGEFSAIAGGTDEQARLKSIYEHRRMAPISIVLDPAITRHTPEWLWLSTGIRAVDHAVETLASFHSNYFCDGIADSALRLLADGLARAKADPTDLDARAQCQVGAWQAMIPITAGVPMGGSHAIGHILGGTCNVAHGHTSCVMSPHVLEWNLPVNAERQRRISACMGEPDRPAHELVDALIRQLGMPRTLREVGVEAEMLPLIAEHTLKDVWARSNARPLTKSEDVLTILQLALH